MLRLALGVVVGVGTFVVVSFATIILGGTECDKGECNALGEWVDEHGGLWLLTALLLSVGGGIAAARMRRR